jgi:sec-independent protein translocase protein TatA
MLNVGPMEVIVVLVVALLIIGPKKLPDMGRSVGRGMREFKHAVTGAEDHHPALDAVTHPAAAAPEPAPAERPTPAA